eukprot:scaffold8409_cov114-Isochrysis_galbana.AAC.5
MDELLFMRSDICLVGLSNFPRGPRGLPIYRLSPAPTAFAHRVNNNKNSPKRPPPGRTCESA